MSEPDWAPLTGFRVAVTSARRAEELGALLQRRGATVTSAAAITMVPLPDDDALRAAHRGADRRAARHRDRHHRHRIPRLGRRGRRLGAGQRPDLARSARHASCRAAPRRRARCAPRDCPRNGRPSRSRRASCCTTSSRAASPASASRCSCTAPPRTGIRSPSSSTNCAPPVPKWCRSGSTAGIPRPATATSTNWWRVSRSEKFDAVSFTSAPAVASVLMRAAEMGIEDRVLVGAAQQRARDVRRAGDRPAAGATRCADVGAGANEVGRVGPSHHRRTAAAVRAHIRVAGHLLWRSAAPACSSTARSRRFRRQGWRRSARSRIVPARWCRAMRCLRRCPAAAPIPTPSRRRCCGCEPRLGDKNIVSTVVKRGYRLGRRRGNGARTMSHRAGRARHSQERRCGRWSARLAERVAAVLGAGVHVAFVDVLGPTPAEVLRGLGGPAVVVPAFLVARIPRQCRHTRACRGERTSRRHRHRCARTESRKWPAYLPIGSSKAVGVQATPWSWRRRERRIRRARRDLHKMAAWVSALTSSRVELAFAATGEPQVSDAVAQLRRRGARRVVVASYLLADGLFQDRLRNSGADAVTDPLGSHPAMVRLIANRFQRARVAVPV